MSAIMSHFSQVAWLSVVFERLYGTVFGMKFSPVSCATLQQPMKNQGSPMVQFDPTSSQSFAQHQKLTVTERPQTKTGRSFEEVLVY